MELLPLQIKRNGFIYDLEKRGNKTLIYKQTDAEDNFVCAYEVFKIKVDQPKVIFGIELPEREVFPGNEDFGKWAWAISSKERADQKFEYLETEEEDAQD